MAEKGSQENTEAIVKGNTKSSEELGLPEALEDLMELDLEAHGVGGLKSKDKDKSMDLDIYDDLYEMEPAGSTKSKEVDRSLELDIYDDLDDFQKVEDRKTKELQEWEAKYEKALAEIVALKAENKALGKKIKTMEVNLQNLLDTAKAEIKRKETLISELRNEKDDVCFRRKRARPFELPGVSEPESKRTKEFQAKPIDAKTDMETDRNPFKAAKDGAKKFTATEDARKMMTTKDDTKKFTAKEDVRKMMTTKDDTKKIALKDVESAAIFKDDNKKPILKDNDQKWFSKDHATKSITREDDKKSVQRSKFPRPEYSKTTDRKSTTQTRRPENRHRSRDRHHSRSRSPKHSSRRDYHRSQESKSRHAKRRSHSASPSKIHLSRESTKANTTLTGNEANDQRSRSPILESTKLVYESQPPRKGVSKRRDAASETNANSSSEPKNLRMFLTTK
ncbi:ankyrin repeat domain-containing protein 12 isoform X2 [Drosophila santomea]|uniref:ankyrin repeat domain-containing protein 12 isoform X2 n=1 Tax=Drosophila santomea TaxID=129105 RepID=UPI001953294D|nr:ankyrin repeat domain-containing protein 12 isoform X2 [Drosophila santomea]